MPTPEEQQNANAAYIAAEAGQTIRHTSTGIAQMPGGMTLALVVLAAFSACMGGVMVWFMSNTLKAQEVSDTAASQRLTEYLMADTENQSEALINILRGFSEYTETVEASRSQEVRRSQEAATKCADNMARLFGADSSGLLPPVTGFRNE